MREIRKILKVVLSQFPYFYSLIVWSKINLSVRRRSLNFVVPFFLTGKKKMFLTGSDKESTEYYNVNTQGVIFITERKI